MARIFLLKPSQAADGDYGNIRRHGTMERVSGVAVLKRVASKIPPISFPFGGMIVTSAFRNELETAGLSGLSFLPTFKQHVAKTRGKKVGAGSEPEALLDTKHDKVASKEIGDLYELLPPQGAELYRLTKSFDTGRIPVGKIFAVATRRFKALDFCRPYADFVWTMWLVSERAKEWLELHVPEWVVFDELRFTKKTEGVKTSIAMGRSHPRAMPRAILSAPKDEHLEGYSISPGGRFCALAGCDHRVRIWSLETGQMTRECVFVPPGINKATVPLNMSLSPEYLYGLFISGKQRYLGRMPFSTQEEREVSYVTLGTTDGGKHGGQRTCRCRDCLNRAREDLDAFSADAQTLVRLSNHLLQRYDLTSWPPVRSDYPVPEGNVEALKIGSRGKYCCLKIDGKGLWVSDFRKDSWRKVHSEEPDEIQGFFVMDEKDLVVRRETSIRVVGLLEPNRRWEIALRDYEMLEGVAPDQSNGLLVAMTRKDTCLISKYTPNGEVGSFLFNPDEPHEASGIRELFADGCGRVIGANVFNKHLVFWKSTDWSSGPKRR